jgi:hypothetical protein
MMKVRHKSPVNFTQDQKQNKNPSAEFMWKSLLQLNQNKYKKKK